MTEHQPKLALGPVLYYWPKEQLLDFYERISAAPLDIIYLGETVCSKRHALNTADWLALAEQLSATGKEIVLSTMALLEAESELKTLRRLCENGRFTVEANDMGAVRLLVRAENAVRAGHRDQRLQRPDLALSRRAGRETLGDAGGIVAADSGHDSGRTARRGGNRSLCLRADAAGLFRPLLHRPLSQSAQGRLPIPLSGRSRRTDPAAPAKVKRF